METDDHRYRSSSEAKVRSIFTKEMIDFLEQMVRPDGNWPGIKNDDLIGGIVDAVANTAKKIPDGMGVGLLHSLAYTALDAATHSISGEPCGINQKKYRPEHANSASLSPLPRNKPTENGLENLEVVSPLRAMGYTVAEGALTEGQRRDILRKAVGQKVLDPESVDQSDLRWGCRNTSDRLWAIAGHLFWLARFQGAEKPGAKERWLSDIDWLRKSFSDLASEIDWTSFDSVSIRHTKRAPNPAFMSPLTPSPSLAAIVGSKPIYRTEVTKKIWEYIKRHKLRDGVNKRMINADKKLLKIFGRRQVSMFEMTKLVNNQLKP